METTAIHPQIDNPAPRFHSLKNSVYYIRKVTGSSGIGPPLETIITPPTPDEQYTEKNLYVSPGIVKPDLPSITNILHWHQPLGNAAKGIYKGVKKLMDILYDYYLMQLEVWETFVINNPQTGYIETVHLTGTLITWLAQEHPEWLKRFVRLVRGKVTGNPDEAPHFELFISPYFESLASTMPLEEAIRQTEISIHVMNYFGMKPSGYWLVERIWEPGYFAFFTRELRKLGINKAAIDDHLFYKMSKREMKTSGYNEKSFSEKDLRGYYILDDDLKDEDPFYILPANRDYRQARPYWLSEVPRKGGKFISYWLQGYLKGSIPKEKITRCIKNNYHIFRCYFIQHPILSFEDDALEYVIFKDNLPALLEEESRGGITPEEKQILEQLWEESQKDRYTRDQFLIWAGDGEKPTNLWRYIGDKNRHKENLGYARQWLYEELETKINNQYANYLPSSQLIERSSCKGYITLPFGAYKEMTWWAHTTGDQERLNELIAKIDELKTLLLHYHPIAEELGDEVISDEEILQYEKLSNTEIAKYNILLQALKKRRRLAHCRKYKITSSFLTRKEETELKNLEKGIPWKNFWKKYKESYKYHRLWLFLYHLTKEHVDQEQLKELIFNLLGRATVNCGSWHGVFGGRYLANLRNDMMWGIAAAASVYLYALEEKGLFKKGDVVVRRFDIMGALGEELRLADIKTGNRGKKKIPDIIVMTYRMMAVISLKNGGTLFDWIYYDTGNPLSVINTINLIKEPYHDDAKKMVSWFKEKLSLYHQFTAVADAYLDERDKDRYILGGKRRGAGVNNPYTVTYTELQDKISSLKTVYDMIIEDDPANIKIISLYEELIKRPDFSGTKTKTKPIQNLNVIEALKDYDDRLPVNQILRLRDRDTQGEIGLFDKADYTLNTINEKDGVYTISIQAEDNSIIVEKQIRIHKTLPLITFLYTIRTTGEEQNIDVEIENNTNMSFLDEKTAWFEINRNMHNITGPGIVSSVESLKIVNQEDNSIQHIGIHPGENRLIIQPRYSVSQGLRLFETTLQYVRYLLIFPLCLSRDKPCTIIMSHSLDSRTRMEEENEWIMKQ